MVIDTSIILHIGYYPICKINACASFQFFSLYVRVYVMNKLIEKCQKVLEAENYLKQVRADVLEEMKSQGILVYMLPDGTCIRRYERTVQEFIRIAKKKEMPAE